MTPILTILLFLLLTAEVRMADADPIIVRNGGCTLVDAIIAANTDARSGKCPAGNGADTILITKDVPLSEIIDTTDGKNGLPSITSDITIEGNGLEIRRQVYTPGLDFRLFHVASTGTLTLEHISVRGGSSVPPVLGGAGIYIAGGRLNLNFVRLSDYVALDGKGGAIYNNGGTVTIWQTDIRASGGRAGGAIYNGGGGQVDIAASFISGYRPHSTIDGLGIFNDISSTVTIQSSYIDGISNAGEMSITNSMISGYTNDNGFIYNRASGHIALNFTTLTHSPNSGYFIPTIYNEGLLELNNSIVYDLGASECYGSGTFSGSNNLGSSNACPGILDLLPKTLLEMQQHLRLADGHIETTSSYAYNRLGDCGLLDKDYFPRDAQCDIGAFEYTGPAITGKVWQDFNGVGAMSLSGLDNIGISLYDADGNVVDAAVTANGGRYWFDHVAPGTYTVGITLANSYTLTLRHYAGDGQALREDSDGYPDTGLTAPITLYSYNTAKDFQSDFGIYQPVTMSGIVFEDTNQNGIYDPGEKTLPWIEIFARRINPSMTYASFTDGNGGYLFTDMLPGLYDITFELDPDYYANGASGGQAIQTIETNNAVTDASDPAQVQTTSPLTLAVHVAPNDNGLMYMDFGFLKVSPPNAAPSRNYFTTDILTLSWNRVTGATQYEIQVDNTRTFTAPLDFSATVPANTLYATTTPLPNGIHYWRVRALSQDGIPGVWSAIESFIVNVP